MREDAGSRANIDLIDKPQVAKEDATMELAKTVRYEKAILVG